MKHSKKDVEGFKASMLGCREVVNIYHLAGKNDFLLYIAVRDKNHLRDFVMEQISSLDYVKSVETSLIYDFQNNPLFPIYLEPR